MKALSTSFILSFLIMTTQAQNNTPAFAEFQDVYSVYITKELKASKEFYTTWLDFDVVFEASWFVYMQTKGERKLTLALIDEKHPSTPPAYGAFNGRGSFLTLQVANATALYEMLKKKNAPISYPLTKEDWGQLRFGMTDPNGLYVDIVEQIEPKEGYWEQYMER
jgi:uncharacterized glyoxalase superfamily protein PhnB